jgi:hypothetical protein
MRAASEPELKWNHEQGTRLLEEVWRHLIRSTILKGSDFGTGGGVVDENDDEAPESDEGVDDESDAVFETGSSALSESAPSEPFDFGMTEDCARRINLARTRAVARVIDGAIEVSAARHEQPLINSLSSEEVTASGSNRSRRHNAVANLERLAGDSGNYSNSASSSHSCSTRHHIRSQRECPKMNFV